MQLCAISHLASEHPSTKFYAVSGDLPFANDAFKRRLDLSFDVLSDPRLDTCDKWVGRCRLGNFLKEAGVSDALEGVETCARGCVVVKEGVVVYVTSGGDDPGKMPDLGEVKKALGV